VEGWFAGAGLGAACVEVIAPDPAAGEKLTVKLWLARKGNKHKKSGA
jgi:hypothetical protein